MKATPIPRARGGIWYEDSYDGALFTTVGRIYSCCCSSGAAYRTAALYVTTQDNTPPGSIFKAQVLHGRMIVSPEKSGTGKISSRAVRKRVVWF